MPAQSKSFARRNVPLKGLQWDDDYSVLMIGARRDAAPAIGAPAISRHLGFWVPDNLALGRDEWIKEIENFILRLYYHLDQPPTQGVKFDPVSQDVQTKDSRGARLYLIHNSYPTKEDGGPSEPLTRSNDRPTRHHSFSVSFQWQLLPVEVRLELIDEYFTISISISLSHLTDAQRSPPEGSLSFTLQEGIQAFNDVATRRYRATARSAAAGASVYAGASETPEQLKGPHEAIYHTIWQKLDDDIFAPFAAKPAVGLGKVFVDFRSFVASRGGDDSFIALPGTTIGAEQPLDRAIGGWDFNKDDAIRCVDAILPFITADEWIDRSKNAAGIAEPLEQRELTFTPVLNGRCIYASALGTPPSHLQDHQLPLTYMLLSANHCPAELGQLVDGFHMLGATRLAALYDLPHLLIAAVELRKLEERIDWFQLGMTLGTADELLAANLPGFVFRLTQISRGIEMEDNKWNIVGGLPFRVERSKYYQKQFDRLVQGLRIGTGRIEGFPTYTECVARRLGGVYDLINTVGLRYERLNRQLRTIEQLLFQRELTKNTETIEKIQEGAEILFFAVLFPYYVSRFFGDLANTLQFAQSIPLVPGFRLKIDTTIMIFSIAIGATRAYYLLRTRKVTGTAATDPAVKNKRRGKLYQLSLVFFVIVISFFLSALFTYLSDHFGSGANSL